jgi:hypothetical protein
MLWESRFPDAIARSALAYQMGENWLDVMASELERHGYMVTKPATITLSLETLEGARGLIERLREVGEAAETATGSDLAELDEEASVLHKTLSDLLIGLLVEAGLVEPLIAGEGCQSRVSNGGRPPWPQKAGAVL